MDDQITVADLARLKTIIEVACSRGAFQAPEIKSVGEVYERLTAFLTQVMKQAESHTEESKGDTQ